MSRSEGAEAVRRALVDWLSGMDLVQAGASAVVDRFVGYYEPYATSHEALDADDALFEEVRNAARSLLREVELTRDGRVEPDDGLRAPREK